MKDDVVVVTVVLLDTDAVYKVGAQFIAKIHDVGAGIYKQVELANGECGMVILTKELETELRRLGTISD